MKKEEQIVTESRMTEKVALEIIMHRVPEITIKKAIGLARDLSVQIRNTIYYIEKENLNLTDKEANSESYWIHAIQQSGKNFNKKDWKA